MLVSFIAVVFFSFATMAHGDEGSMQGNCPFSVIGGTSCPQNLTAATVHHIFAYQSFLSVLAETGVTAVITLLLALYAAVLFSFRLPLYKPPERVKRFFNTVVVTPQDRATIRWLSLLENSPATL